MNAASPTPAAWRWRALDAQGQPQQGSIQAANARDALHQLQRRQLTVLELQPQGGPADSATPASADAAERPQGGVRPVDRMALLQELSTLLNAGVSLAEAAPSLAQAYAGAPLGVPLARLQRALQSGRPVGEAFRGAGLGLPEHAHSLIEAGDASGRLGAALQAAARQLEYDLGVRQQMKSALVYPSVLVASGVVAVFIIFVAVVPRFASLLGSGRAEVPALSRWIIGTGMYFQANMLLSITTVAATLAALVLLLRVPAVRQALLEALARAPVVGPWLTSSETGRWATLLATLLDNRVPMLQALELSARGLLLQRMRNGLAQAQGDIRRGRALSDILLQQGWVPATRVNLVRVGERAGELPRMLAQLGQMQTEAARGQLQRVLALVEPLAILLIGSVIGVIMLGVVLAITSLNTARF